MVTLQELGYNACPDCIRKDYFFKDVSWWKIRKDRTERCPKCGSMRFLVEDVLFYGSKDDSDKRLIERLGYEPVAHERTNKNE